jgi:hypothetical protein
MAARSMSFSGRSLGTQQGSRRLIVQVGSARQDDYAANKEFPMAEKPRQHAEDERKRIEVEEDEVTLNSDESFPASDPPSFNPGVTGPGDVKKRKADARH